MMTCWPGHQINKSGSLLCITLCDIPSDRLALNDLTFARWISTLATQKKAYEFRLACCKQGTSIAKIWTLYSYCVGCLLSRCDSLNTSPELVTMFPHCARKIFLWWIWIIITRDTNGRAVRLWTALKDVIIQKLSAMQFKACNKTRSWLFWIC